MVSKNYDLMDWSLRKEAVRSSSSSARWDDFITNWDRANIKYSGATKPCCSVLAFVLGWSVLVSANQFYSNMGEATALNWKKIIASFRLSLKRFTAQCRDIKPNDTVWDGPYLSTSTNRGSYSSVHGKYYGSSHHFVNMHRQRNFLSSGYSGKSFSPRCCFEKS